jgi:MFS family permease
MTLSPWAPEYRRLSIGIVALVSVFGFEGIAIGAVMPVAAADLDAISNYAVAFTSFTMASLLGMTFAGLWANKIGLARVIIFAVASLAFGSMVAGFAPNLAVLTVGRSIQGFAMGIDLVTMYVVIGRMYPEALRAKALGMLAAAWVVPGLVGPGIAGLLVEVSSWRMTFWIVPLLLIGPIVLLIPELKKLPFVPSPVRTDARIQITSVLIAIGALSVFQAGASHVGRWNTELVAAIFVVSLGVTAWSTKALMPAGYLRMAAGIPAIVGMRGVLAGAFFAAEIYVPLALQEIRGTSVALSGGVLTAATITWFAGSWLQGSHKLNYSREQILFAGVLLVSVGIALTPVAVFGPTSIVIAALAASVVWGIAALGMGMCFPTLGVLMLDKSPDEEHARHSASLQMSDSFGVIIATAIAGSVLALASVQQGIESSTFVTIWIFCVFVGLSSLLFIPQIQRKATIRP